MDLARRSLFSGRLRTPQPLLRPPWSPAEGTFTSMCTRCGDCLKACPTGVLQAGPGGTPVADFSHSHCTFCGDCSRVCTPHAIAAERTMPAWDLAIHIGAGCLTEQNVVCRSCGEICESAAIRFAPRLGGVAKPEVLADRCTACGECVGACPSQAIRVARQEQPVISEIAA